MGAIICYHAIDESGGLYSTPPRRFAQHMETLAGEGAAVTSLAHVAGTPGALALTFDDGDASFLTHALPLLVRYQLPATVFPVARAFTAAELREIAAAGIEIGAHSMTHADLSALDHAAALEQMRASQRHLEDAAGVAVRAFAYPYGRSNPNVRAQARTLFDRACGVRTARATARSDAFNLPRVFDFYARSPFWLTRLGQPVGAAYLGARRNISAARRTLAGAR